MIPCIDCLVYAMCKNKKKIKCILLFNWMKIESNDRSVLYKLFPRWRLVSNER
jgi:hypothetical protein